MNMGEVYFQKEYRYRKRPETQRKPGKKIRIKTEIPFSCPLSREKGVLIISLWAKGRRRLSRSGGGIPVVPECDLLELRVRRRRHRKIRLCRISSRVLRLGTGEGRNRSAAVGSSGNDSAACGDTAGIHAFCIQQRIPSI